jgi:hypothetical protein
MNKTLLAIGDTADWDSYLKFYRQRRLLKKYKFGFATTDYDSVLNGDCPPIASKTIIILLFFPFVYWDREIEPKTYPGLYGTKRFYSQLKRFWKIVAKKIEEHYEGKKIHFLNSPKNIPTERDKKLTKQILASAGIHTPRSYRIVNVPAIVHLLRQGKKLFIKVRYGSMGKGITYLEQGKWYTNFGLRGSRIVNRHSDYGWKFRDVTGNRTFLKQLLTEDVIVEEAIPRWVIGNAHFDLRLHVFFDKVIYMYPRCNTVCNITTNVSQGATSKTMAFLKGISRNVIAKAERTGIKARRALGLNFAGVDIMLHPEKHEPIVIEVNAFPGFPKVRTFNLARYLIAEIGKRRWK